MKKIKTSLILNIILVAFDAFAIFCMFNRIKFMPAKDLLNASNIEMFKYYTVDSNILIGIVSLILITFQIRLLKKKINKIPNIVYILKFIGTAAITLTLVVTAVFLTPRYGIYPLYNNSNLFFHFLVPLLALISYIFFEKHENKYKYAIFGIIPMVLYSIYYIGQVLLNLNNGGLTYKYDFYGFLGGKITNIYIVVPFIYLIMYLMSLLIIYLNKKRKTMET